MTVVVCGGLLGAGVDDVCEQLGSWLWPGYCPGSLYVGADLLQVWLLKEPVFF